MQAHPLVGGFRIVLRMVALAAACMAFILDQWTFGVVLGAGILGIEQIMVAAVALGRTHRGARLGK